MKFRLSNLVLSVVLLAATITLLLLLDSDVETLLKAGIANSKPAIVVNQVGYLPQSQKIAFFRYGISGKTQNIPDTAELINQESGEIVTAIPIEPQDIDYKTQDRTAKIDFSSITQPGTYYLRTQKYQSVPFEIGQDIYQQPLIKLSRSYYTQRCGIAIQDPITGISHPPCHLQDGIIAHSDAEHPAATKINTVGGWHDGGSYNKYVAPATATIGRLLSVYEQNPELFPDNQLDIPESGNGRSDLLDEMEFGLEWLLKMQRQDGAVYRKVAGKKWLLDLAPDEDTQPRYIYGISTPETAKFAGVMAIASRVYEDSERSPVYLAAANRAWQYLATQPQMQIDWVKGDESGSDSYLADQFNLESSLTIDLDDRFWAAAELYITTGIEDFANYLQTNIESVEYTLFEWKNPAPLGMVNYLRQNRQPVNSKLVEQIEAKILQRADLLLKKVEQSVYNLANDRFVWGSNKITAEEGITLVAAYQLTQNTQYLDAAIAQLDYLLGRNHFNQTFITDIGTHSVNNLSSLYSRATGIKFPGLLVSGANGNSPDGKVFRYKGQLSYADDELSFATNGNATDYNAAIIGLIVNLLMANS